MFHAKHARKLAIELVWGIQHRGDAIGSQVVLVKLGAARVGGDIIDDQERIRVQGVQVGPWPPPVDTPVDWSKCEMQ